MIEKGQVTDISLEQIVKTTDKIYPSGVIPAYHYCDDWRDLKKDDWYVLWESKPKLAHIDVVRYPPDVTIEQAEVMNDFMKNGGGLAIGVLPNVDDAYSGSVVDTLEKNLTSTVAKMINCGIDIDLVKRNTMVSTQCGLSGASVQLTREIHEQSTHFKSMFHDIIERVAR